MATSSSSSSTMIYDLILQRNAVETDPFVSIHEAYGTLVNQVDALQTKYHAAKREISTLRQQLHDVVVSTGGGGGSGAPNSGGSLSSGGGNISNAAAAAALKNEARLRDKLEKIQEEMNAKLKAESEHRAEALKTMKELGEMKDLNTAQERTIQNLRDENDRSERVIEHLTNEMNDAKSRTELAEKQYEGLKHTIRLLQDENDKLSKQNRVLEDRVVSEKGKTVEEMNLLHDMVNALKMEVDMLRTYKHQEEHRNNKGGWFGTKFGASASAGNKDADPNAASNDKSESDATRKFGNLGVCVPTKPKQTIEHAHNGEGTCVRYDHDGGSDLIATASSDATVKVWDVNTGQVRATLRGTNTGHSILGCDISNGLVVGGGSDKTCRVWNLRTERMVHHCVGHQHKITCVRFFGGNHSILTASADRSMKVWDISRTTYRQTTTLRHSSTTNSIDVGSDSYTVVSGHLDGGLRFWDVRSGDRVSDIPDIHEGGITSVQFNPVNSVEVLTNSLDSSLKIVDTRNGIAVQTFREQGFNTVHGWSRSSYSPDGKYVIAGSNSTGDIYVWNASDGTLKSKLSGHKVGVCAIDWGRGGSSGQQVSSMDRRGNLVLWA